MSNNEQPRYRCINVAAPAPDAKPKTNEPLDESERLIARIASVVLLAILLFSVVVFFLIP